VALDRGAQRILVADRLSAGPHVEDAGGAVDPRKDRAAERRLGASGHRPRRRSRDAPAARRRARAPARRHPARAAAALARRGGRARRHPRPRARRRADRRLAALLRVPGMRIAVAYNRPTEVVTGQAEHLETDRQLESVAKLVADTLAAAGHAVERIEADWDLLRACQAARPE